MAGQGTIDFHTHAFPDALASRAVPLLAAKANIRAALDGTVGALLSSMDRAGIAASVVCSIATEPGQFEAIRRWSSAIASPRLIPFPSVHPSAQDPAQEVRQLASEGFAGVKLHPEYQDFHIDEPRLESLYHELQRSGMITIFHAGHDIGFPDSDRAAPRRILSVHRAFPALRIVASHLGGFRRWEEVATHVCGSGIWLDTSFSIGHAPDPIAREIIHAHRSDRLLFGSDSPWADQEGEVAKIRALDLPPWLTDDLLKNNARRLLGLDAGVNQA